MYHNILVPLDGTDMAEAVLDHVKKMACENQAKVILLQVEDVPMMLGHDEVIDTSTYHRRLEKRKKRVKSYLANLTSTFPCRRVFDDLAGSVARNENPTFRSDAELCPGRERFVLLPHLFDLRRDLSVSHCHVACRIYAPDVVLPGTVVHEPVVPFLIMCEVDFRITRPVFEVNEEKFFGNAGERPVFAKPVSLKTTPKNISRG